MAMAVMAEWWEAAAADIVAYTGMTPAAFFTAVAVAAALYVAISGLLERPAQVSARRREAAEEEERALEPLRPPVQLGEVTAEELSAYDGSDPKKPLLMAIKGQIYDVTQSRMFYGPGGPYALFTGRDASRALAKMSFETSDLTGDISGLSPFEAEALQEWEYKFKSKYITVGTIKKTIPVAEGDIARSTVTTERDIDASTFENNSVPELKETGASNQESVTEKTTGTPDVDVNTSSHEDMEKGKELSDSDATNTSSQVDAVEKPDETSNLAVKNSSTEEAFEPKEIPEAAVKNSSRTEEAVDPKETPQVVDEKNRCKPEDATEKPNEEADAVGLKNTTRHEDATEEAVEPKEIPDVVVKNSSTTEEAVEPKETPQVVDDKNKCKPEDATERPNEAADAVGLKNTTRHEDAGQPEETWNIIDEKDVSSRQDGEEKPKETSDVEAKDA
ncbi:unnamed protein product [Urochloa decumbens]|uniref:Cytochrome b5 heme-binding domain-containing protein n=1 Tax=Urochloa decumbens TaxID=240449 RepID=A0ABC9CIH8_9POAL